MDAVCYTAEHKVSVSDSVPLVDNLKVINADPQKHCVLQGWHKMLDLLMQRELSEQTACIVRDGVAVSDFVDAANDKVWDHSLSAEQMSSAVDPDWISVQPYETVFEVVVILFAREDVTDICEHHIDILMVDEPVKGLQHIVEFAAGKGEALQRILRDEVGVVCQVNDIEVIVHAGCEKSGNFAKGVKTRNCIPFTHDMPRFCLRGTRYSE